MPAQAARLILQPAEGPPVPLIKVSLYPGRTEEQKQKYAEAVTRAASDILGAKKEHVIVVYDERPRPDWYLAGKQL